MKDTIQTAIILVIVILVAFIVVTTKGEDKLNIKFDFNFKTEETFSYDLATSEYNGEYKLAGKDRYIMFGRNPDGTYRAYFIFLTASVKNITLRLDNLTLESDNTLKFTNLSGTALKIKLNGSSLIVMEDGELSLGDNAIEGEYYIQKPINKFSLSEFEIFNTRSVG